MNGKGTDLVSDYQLLMKTCLLQGMLVVHHVPHPPTCSLAAASETLKCYICKASARNKAYVRETEVYTPNTRYLEKYEKIRLLPEVISLHVAESFFRS